MPKLKKKSIEQRSRADEERKQQIRGKSLHVGNLSEYNTNSQEREFSHETALLHAEGASSNIGNCTGTEKNDGSKQSSAIEMKYTISKLNEPYVAETIVDRYLKSQDKIAKSSQYIRLMRTNADWQQSLFAMHESYGLSAVPTKIVACLRGGERNKRIASRIVQMKFERERGMRGLHHILFTWPASWLVSKKLRQQSLLAMHESYGLSAVPTKIVAWFSQGGERNKRIASRIVQIKFERETAMRGSHHILFTWPASWLVSKVLRQQSLLAMHESYGLSAVPTKIVAWLRGGERNKRIASRIVQMKFERERGMRGSHHILFTWPASWLVSKVLRQQSLLAMHESYGLSAVPTKIVAWFSQGGERNKRIASRILQMRRAETGDSFT